MSAFDFFDQLLPNVSTRGERYNRAAEFLSVADVNSQTTAPACRLGHCSEICANARTAIPQALDDRKTKTFKDRRVDRKIAFAI